MLRRVVSMGISLLVILSFAQAPDTLWTKTYGGSAIDIGYSVRQTADNGLIVVGITQSFGAGGSDVYLIKTDVNGDSLWTRTYGDSSSDAGYSVEQTNDGGYIISGGTHSFGVGGSDVYLIKTDSAGDTSWTRTYGTVNHEDGRSVQQTYDGGYIVGGWTGYQTGNADFLLLKTDENGDTLWTQTFNGESEDLCYAVRQTADSGFIMVGTAAYGSGHANLFIVRTDRNGDTLWTKTYGGNAGEHGRSVQQTMDGGFIITGWTGSFAVYGEDVWLLKTDAYGDTLWTRTYNRSLNDRGEEVQQTCDGGYVIAGMTAQMPWVTAWWDVYVLRTDSLGTRLWHRCFGHLEADDWGYSVEQTSDSGYVITGHKFMNPGRDLWIIKLASDMALEEEQSKTVKDIGFGPTIVRGPLRLPEGKSCKVFDITGRVVAPDRIAPGVYFLQVDEKIVQKIVKIR